MTLVDISIIGLAIACLVNTYHCFVLNKRINLIREEWEVHKQVREKLYEELADPLKIESDFEKSARAREMRDAQRSTLPRDDAWPPAKVHRPKMRGAKPGKWRLQRP